MDKSSEKEPIDLVRYMTRAADRENLGSAKPTEITWQDVLNGIRSHPDWVDFDVYPSVHNDISIHPNAD